MTCDYCQGIGACPKCWGRAAIEELKAEIAELKEGVRLKKYRLHWKGTKGETQEITGTDIANAFNRAGIGAGALRALDFWEPIEDD